MRATFFLSLLLVFSFISCGDNIQGPSDNPETPSGNMMRATFSSIQSELFNTTCAKSGCHADRQNPVLSEGNAYKNLVNVKSIANPSLLRVKPFDSANSYIIRKLRADGVPVMPPTGKLSNAIIDSVAAWIDRGALNN